MLHANTTAWRSQQRHRITNLFNYPTGTRKLIVEKSDYLRNQASEIHEFETSTLVEQYMNVSFIGQKGKPYFVSHSVLLVAYEQCWHDGTCEELDKTLIYRPRIEPDEALKFRYILDIDGHGWSSRFRRELTTGSVLMKATVHVGPTVLTVTDFTSPSGSTTSSSRGTITCLFRWTIQIFSTSCLSLKELQARRQTT
jgi:beta-1,2-xylosyltransferase